MASAPCTHSELITRVVALESGLQAFKELMDERDRRYMQRANAQDQAVQTALATSEKAVNKAEMATEKRLEGLNEIRTMSLDQAKTFAPLEQVNLLVKGLEARLQTTTDLLNTQMAHGGGMKDAWGYFAVGIGLVIASLAIYFRH